MAPSTMYSRNAFSYLTGALIVEVLQEHRLAWYTWLKILLPHSNGKCFAVFNYFKFHFYQVNYTILEAFTYSFSYQFIRIIILFAQLGNHKYVHRYELWPNPWIFIVLKQTCVRIYKGKILIPKKNPVLSFGFKKWENSSFIFWRR